MDSRWNSNGNRHDYSIDAPSDQIRMLSVQPRDLD